MNSPILRFPEAGPEVQAVGSFGRGASADSNALARNQAFLKAFPARAICEKWRPCHPKAIPAGASPAFAASLFRLIPLSS
jgi:hypothetical protein